MNLTPPPIPPEALAEIMAKFQVLIVQGDIFGICRELRFHGFGIPKVLDEWQVAEVNARLDARHEARMDGKDKGQCDPKTPEPEPVDTFEEDGQ